MSKILPLKEYFMSVQKLVRIATIAAVYIAMCLVFAPISYGPVQVRLAEALTILAVLSPHAIIGLTLGCFIANMITGVAIDMVVGTAATLIAAILTYQLRNIRFRGLPVLSSLPPVILNAIFVGAQLAYLFPIDGASFAVTWASYGFSVGVGQVISCCFLGLLLIYVIEKRPVLQSLLQGSR